MKNKHWFSVITDIISAFSEDDYNKIKKSAQYLLNFIDVSSESELRVREKIYAVYDELESVIPGTAEKLTGIAMGVWLKDGRKSGVDDLTYRYIVYNNVYKKDSRDDYFRLKAYDKYCDGSKIITVNNGLNEDENNDHIWLIKPAYTYGSLSWDVIEDLFAPFFRFVLSTKDYDDFKKHIFVDYVHRGARILTTFNEDLAEPLLEKKPVNLPPEWEKRYQDLINS